MMCAGVLGALKTAWGMSSTQAGSIQTAFNFSYGSSLVISSILADRFGAKQVLLTSSWLTVLSALVFSSFAHSYFTALLLLTVQGLAQGGTYAPSLMLVAQGMPVRDRGNAMGWLLASSSIGYLASIAASGALAARFGYRMAFLACATGPVVGLIAALLALRSLPKSVLAGRIQLSVLLRIAQNRRSLLVTIGYAAHCWELLGMWGWMPAFVSAHWGPAAWRLLVVAVAIHGPAIVGALAAGRASSSLRHKPLLLGVGLAGATCSFSAGWLTGLPFALLALFVGVYSLTTFSDSPILSAAITEFIAEENLGAALAVRSVGGFCAGGLAPVAFGWAVSAATYGGNQTPWAYGFSILGFGGALAAFCAWLLPTERRP